jgi:hypothetical protein
MLLKKKIVILLSMFSKQPIENRNSLKHMPIYTTYIKVCANF